MPAFSGLAVQAAMQIDEAGGNGIRHGLFSWLWSRPELVNQQSPDATRDKGPWK
jgi:hypothetical protein